MSKNRNTPYYLSRKADPTLRVFVDALRDVLDLDPLYCGDHPSEVERFYRPARESPNPRNQSQKILRNNW